MRVRVLVEALGAKFGGIRTYVEHLLDGWPLVRPEDELLVLADRSHDLHTGDLRTVQLDIGRPGILARPLAQTRATRSLVRSFEADVVLATHPVTSLLATGVPLGVVVHDLRHEILPHQFSRSRRLIRKASYGRTYQLADGFVSVSERTRNDLVTRHPRLAGRPSVVAHHGADHALAWPGRPRTGPAVTFAHHSNKNSDLVIDGWAAARRLGGELPELVVLGGGGQREVLEARARELGVADLIRVEGWLPDEQFQELVGSAGLVVMSSDFEGFGLPVIEAMVRGIPVVIGPEPAMLEVAGGHASVMDAWQPEALAVAVRRALDAGPDALDAAQRHAEEFTWQRCAAQTGAFLETLVRSRPGS